MTKTSDLEKATSKFIEDFVKRHWEEQGAVCYLSNLGLRLKKDLPESRDVIADGLHEYLRRNPIVRVVQHPKIFSKIGAVPLSVDVGSTTDECRISL